MADNLVLRMPEHSDAPCQLCNRRFLKAEAHWFCSICRKNDERAACPDDCQACVAMTEEEWRRKAYLEAEYKKASYHRSKNRGTSSASSFIFSGKRKGGKTKGSPARKRIKSKLGIPRKRSSAKVAAPPPQPPVVTSYELRLHDFELSLYDELRPFIAPNLAEKGFTLPKILPDLKDRYDVARWELIRLLATSSMCYHLSKNRTQFCDENNQIFNANSDGIVSLFASLIKFKANTLGKVIFEIRSMLLKDVECPVPGIISQMINGPIKPRDSFFGNIDALKDAVALDKENVLRIKTPMGITVKEEVSSDEHEFEAFSNDSSDSSE